MQRSTPAGHTLKNIHMHEKESRIKRFIRLSAAVSLCNDWPLACKKATMEEPDMDQGQLPFTFSATYSHTH